MQLYDIFNGKSQWPCGLRGGTFFFTILTLGSRVYIHFDAWTCTVLCDFNRLSKTEIFTPITKTIEEYRIKEREEETQRDR
jgi:hypothetical protein